VKGRDNPVELAKLLFQDRSGNDKVFEELLSHLGLSKSFKPGTDKNYLKMCLDFSTIKFFLDVKVAVNQATQLLPSFLEATANQAVESGGLLTYQYYFNGNLVSCQLRKKTFIPSPRL